MNINSLSFQLPCASIYIRSEGWGGLTIEGYGGGNSGLPKEGVRD